MDIEVYTRILTLFPQILCPATAAVYIDELHLLNVN